MSIPRGLNFVRQGAGSQILEIYLDPICPFSGKILRSIQDNVLPLIGKGGKYEKDLSVVLWPYPQPFHHFSPFHVEALLLVSTIYPHVYVDYFRKLMDTQDPFKNRPVSNMTPSECRDQLTQIAVDLLEANGGLKGPKSQVYGDIRSRLDVGGKPGEGDNKGSEAFDLMKYCIKRGRQNAIHVTPTVMFDALRYDSVSSSWGKEEWEKWLRDMLG
ncbi:hypothetical protein M231_00521 [Tremella mesenterica]|uniref:Thioredoxin-like fold domain-containing protein n=1 Tax=Tremella mesenterica TaxID=5217 RepID=A0A4Q1BVJ6_TREME|nr:uncharacterized protein TREMEDRAFT_39558 [Tremella mesenterica DSM 1558]EIW68649.1 hypothetical protein TREMEDRAFT_39558 [Tremella mesenterica DSM 1558]RXK42164.1 hypothetical protein M231_00521 [Tremella mesenterica]